MPAGTAGLARPRRSRLGDYFDLVGGTSTGAVIAGALALGKSTAEIKDFYLKLAPRVFKRPFWRVPGLQAKFDAKALREEIDNIVRRPHARQPGPDHRPVRGHQAARHRQPLDPRQQLRAPVLELDPPSRANARATPATASTGSPIWCAPAPRRRISSIPKSLRSARTSASSRWPTTNASSPDWPGSRSGQQAAPAAAEGLGSRRKAPDIADTHGLFVDGGVTPFNNPPWRC